MFRLSNLNRALGRSSAPEQPRAERWPVTTLTAHYGRDAAATPAGIKDVSSTGIFLITEEQFPIGQQISLKLQKKSEAELSAELEISLQGQVVRQDQDGIGVSFVLPPSMNLVLWEVLLRSIVNLSDADQVAEAFRTLRTVLFVSRLCQSGAEETVQLLEGELDQDRTAKLFEIAHAVEKLLAQEPDGGRMRAHPSLVANILRNGSWAPDQLILQLWVGLFAASCSVDVPDDSNQIFVDLLVQLTNTEARIFTLACERALRAAPAPANAASGAIVLSPDEIVKVTGVHDLTRNATDLAYLFNLGLIQNVFDFTSYRGMDSFDITPSILGLELYKHCHGHRERIDPDLVKAAREHLAVFFPPPIPSVFENFTPLPPNPPQKK